MQTPVTLPANLSDAAKDGLECVICGADYLRVRTPHVPVGRSETGSQIFACVPCIPAQPTEDAAPKSILLVGKVENPDDLADLTALAWDVAAKMQARVTVASSIDHDVRSFDLVLRDRDFLDSVPALILATEAMTAGVPLGRASDLDSAPYTTWCSWCMTEDDEDEDERAEPQLVAGTWTAPACFSCDTSVIAQERRQGAADRRATDAMRERIAAV
ncbi:hypothetical protein [Streptomyces sp. NPDC088733]|uniref:hypothetical protein n=1 Tax=Streptomyces sp. NPDC088733 TaxID=3365880 RepID=UPI00381409DD